jgi:hypothetical protein
MLDALSAEKGPRGTPLAAIWRAILRDVGHEINRYR